MRNDVTGVGVESAWHAWDWVSTGVVVVPGPSAAVSCQSPEVKVLIRGHMVQYSSYMVYFWGHCLSNTCYLVYWGIIFWIYGLFTNPVKRFFLVYGLFLKAKTAAHMTGSQCNVILYRELISRSKANPNIKIHNAHYQETFQRARQPDRGLRMCN